MCGCVAIYGNDSVAPDIYDAMIAMQHRGQDAAGITTYDGKIRIKKGLGLVRDIFDERNMPRLKGDIGIGHVRYPTVGGTGIEDTQPFIAYSPYGIVMAHNGNLVNYHELKKEMIEKDKRLMNSCCDVEVILGVFAVALGKQKLDDKITMEQLHNAVLEVYKRCIGSYSVVGFIAGQGMFAFRDPHGVRPLLFGSRNGAMRKEYIFTSETASMDLLNFELERDVKPGEVIFINEKREVHSKVLTDRKHIPCIFEYVYFARPDSLLDNISVYKSRIRLGKIMAKQIKNAKLDIDVVVPVPDSSRTAALEIAQELELRYREGLVKNRYIGRTFIMPGQKARRKSIRYKLNAMKKELIGKNVLLVDDSIVRGNTSRKIIQMVREAGAKKVYFCSFSPPVTNPCLYGIDVPTRRELIAHDLTIDEICKSIGADKLFYQTHDDMINAVRHKLFPDQAFCSACFTGKYPIGNVNEEILRKADEVRCCEKKDYLDGDDEDQLNLL